MASIFGHKVVQASAVPAVAGIVVDAKEQTAAAVCRHFGFKALPEGLAKLPQDYFESGVFIGSQGSLS